MVCALEHDVVPALDRRARPGATRHIGGDPGLRSRRLEPCSGGSRGVAVLTWHKNFKGEDWADFQKVEVPIHGQDLNLRPSGYESVQMVIQIADASMLRRATSSWSVDLSISATSYFSTQLQYLVFFISRSTSYTRFL